MRIFSKRKAARFGLIPDKKDKRDFIYKIRKPLTDLPISTERKNINAFIWRYDQKDIGSCVSHGMCEAFRRTLQVTNKPDFDPSPLFAYWISRVDKLKDTGASIRDAFKAMSNYGLCSETFWPYITTKFANTPSEISFTEALDHQVILYEKIEPVTKDAIKDAVSRGYPVVYGKDLYSSFMSQRTNETGRVSTPGRCEKFQGRHCMVIFDYEEAGTIELNSWGRGWGQSGVCEVPWEYVLSDKCRDFWVIYMTE